MLSNCSTCSRMASVPYSGDREREREREGERVGERERGKGDIAEAWGYAKHQ